MRDVKDVRVSEIMVRKFDSLKPSDPVSKAVALLSKTSVNVVPVMSSGKCVGEVNQADLLKLAVDPKKVPQDLVVTQGFGLDLAFYAKTVRDVMTPHELSVDADTLVQDAALLMMREGARSVLVTGNGGVVGVLREEDILRRMR
ncbi:MAG: CBS domain-containing protein [Candidatus Diapherotrites archaeon]|nr:CBS domain-containing protein [Candidatus Diapherotrites archaeon]